MNYDVIIIGAGPGGIFAAYELMQQKPTMRVAVFEAGHALDKRHCPIDGDKIKSCVSCKSCSIMSGFGGAGAFSDGKYNITNDFGGTLYEYIGKKRALDLMQYVDTINMRYGGATFVCATSVAAISFAFNIPPPAQSSKSFVSRMTCTFWTHLCVIWVRI